MKVSYHPSSERGVSQLMYVGDDGLPAADVRERAQMIGLGMAAGYGIAKTRGIVRLGILGVALYLMSGRFPAA